MDPIVWLLLRTVYHISVGIALFLCAVLVLEKIQCHSNGFCHEVRWDTPPPTSSTPTVYLIGYIPNASHECEATSLLSPPPFPGLGNAACMGNSTENNATMGQFIIHLENIALPEDPVLNCPTHWLPSHSIPFRLFFLSCIQSLTWTPKITSLCTLGFSIWFHWICCLKQ